MKDLYDLDPSMALLHPLKRKIQCKTDRDTIISDCYGTPPVLLLVDIHYSHLSFD